MTRKDIIAIGASAGGLKAMRSLVAALPADFEASIFVVLHTPPDSPGLFAELLDNAGPLQAISVDEREPVHSGKIYVARPDHHLVLVPGFALATKGPKENRCRPAVDPLFRSAAQIYGPRVVGVVLTGGLDDGTAGLWAIKQLGGTAVVQDPADALDPSMPRNALAHVQIDYCLPLVEIPPLLVRLTHEAADDRAEPRMPKQIGIEVDIAKATRAIDAGVMEIGEPSHYACPECHGVLLQMKEEGRIRFRCHTGHAYSAESLIVEIKEAADEALWNAVRALDEGALCMRHLAQHIASDDMVERLELSVEKTERQAALVREALHQSPEPADSK